MGWLVEAAFGEGFIEGSRQRPRWKPKPEPKTVSALATPKPSSLQCSSRQLMGRL